MKTTHRSLGIMLAMASLALPSPAQEAAPAGKLKVHAIFASNMVIQRDKPIKVWGWAKPGQAVSVQLGGEKADATAGQGK